jgi:hypothetical protein
LDNYVSNSELAAEIARCQQSINRPNQVSDQLAVMLMSLLNKYSRKACWRMYSYQDEMISAALVQLCCVSEKGRSKIPPILRFDVDYCLKKAARLGIPPLKPNAFAYVTQIVKNSFLRTLKLEQRQGIILDDLVMAAGGSPSHKRQQEEHDRFVAGTDEYVPKLKPKSGRRKKVKTNGITASCNPI